MSPPVSEAHPAEVVFAVEALHVVAATVLLNADVALGAIFSVSRDVVGSLAVVSTLGEPSPAMSVVVNCQLNSLNSLT